MKLRFVLALLLVVVAGAAFLAGRWYGALAAESGAQPSVVLTEDMVILTADSRPVGRVPAGTVLYAVPDPWGDKTALFKIYLMTVSNDEGPIRPDTIRDRRGRETYWLKSQDWLKGQQPQPTAK